MFCCCGKEVRSLRCFSGRVTRWALLLHGTQEAPYIDEITNSDSPKLDMSKKMEYAEGILHDLEDQTSNIESY